MNWPAIFLGCFVIGFVLSALSFGAVALHFPVHLPFIHHVHVPHAPAGHVGHAGHAGHGSAGVSPMNFATLMAFLAWFGGTGYLLTSEFRWLTLPALTTATRRRPRRRGRHVLGDVACAVVAARKHAERGLSDGWHARPGQSIGP